MKAFIWNDPNASPGLRDDVPTPLPAAGEVLVRVHTSSINPVDAAIAAGMLKDMVPHDFPVTLGRDFAGPVERAGSDAARFSAGDEVFGFIPAMAPRVHAGSWAELVAIPEEFVVRKPDSVDAATAGAAPLAAITAMTALDALSLSAGDTLLVIGASGGVGSVAVQLGAAAGATVIAPGLPEDEDYLRGLGATEVPPRDGDIASAVRERYTDGVDALLDAVSFTPGSYDAALKPGGRVASPTNAAGEGPGRTNVMAAPTPDYLKRLAHLLETGTLTINIQQTSSLEEVSDALTALGAGHIQGKRALRIA